LNNQEFSTSKYFFWKFTRKRVFYGSPVGAADRVYLAAQNGIALVIKHSDTYEVLASNKLDDRFDASPAVAGDQLLLKGKEYIYCIAER